MANALIASAEGQWGLKHLLHKAVLEDAASEQCIFSFSDVAFFFSCPFYVIQGVNAPV